MKSSKHVSSTLLWVSALLSASVMASAQYHPPAYHPPAPTYHPPAPAYHPPAPAYHPPAYHPPAPAYHPPAPAYHPPAPAYHPAPAPSRPAYNPGNPSPSRPGPSSPVHSYTPGSPSGGNTSGPRPSSGATTYTPHVYTPGASAESHPSGNTSVSGEGMRSANGVTTYTPHAPASSASYTPAAPAASHVNTYTPSAPAAPHANTYTPATPPAEHVNNSAPSAPAAPHVNTSTPTAPTIAGGGSLNPRPPSPGTAAGGGTHAVYSVPASSPSARPGAGPSTLSPAGSQSVLHQVNTARSGLNGVNHRPIPPGQVAVHSDKSLTVTATNGRKFDLRPNGTLASYNGHGQTATFRGDGHLASVHTSAMDIARSPHGQRTIISERPDHGRLVSTGAHRGYFEHPVNYHGHDYYQRTYVHGDHRFTHEYTRYHYHGREFNHYVPHVTYAPAFYGWAYYPWDSPAAYMWGWASSAFMACNAGFFDPSNSYQSGANWLADYYLGSTLAESFDEGAQAGAASCPAGGADANAAGADAQPAGDETSASVDTPISPEIKQMIADEVKQQLAYENAAAAQPDQAPALDGLPQVLVPNHLFVVDQVLNVSTADGQQCSLSAGDVIKLTAAPPDGAATADLTVLSSRKGDCPSGITVSVPLESLQEMHNNFRAQLDSGLQALREQQGKGGLPVAPMAAITPPPVPADEPPADTENVQALLDTQQQQADQAETSVTQTAFASIPAATPPAH